MGRTKQLLIWQGKPVLQHVLDHLRRAPVQEIILVLGHDRDRILAAVDTGGAKVVFNPEFPEGMSSSIRRGAAAMHSETKAFFIVLGDQPAVGPEVYDRLAAEFERRYPEKTVLIPTHRGKRGHPVLFAARFRGEISGIRGDVGLRAVIENNPEAVAAVEMETEAILEDLDTPEQYEKLKNFPEAAGAPRTLAEAFSLKEKEIISLAGGGGKTTLMFALGRELSAPGKGILLTTTTKIWDPEPAGEFARFFSPDLEKIREWVRANLERRRYLVVAQGKLEGGKLQGIPIHWVPRLLAIPGVSQVIIEADGAAGRPLKAPREGEPVLPAETTLLVPMAGIDALGRPLGEDYVFRSRIAGRILEEEEGAEITEAMIARLLSATLRSKPGGARVVPFINKVDLAGGMEKGRNLARTLLQYFPPGVEKVVLGQARETPPVKEVIPRPT